MAQKLLEQEKTKFQQFVFKKGIYIAMVATFVGLFLGIPLIIWFLSVTILSIGKLFLMLFACGALGLLQWKYVRDHVELEYHQFAMYAFSGFGMCFLNFLLFLNLVIHVHSFSETYAVNDLNIHVNNGSYEINVGDAAFERNLGNYLNGHYNIMPVAKKITINYATGILGFDMIEDCKFK